MIVGHRGASGYRPEHTVASYELAIRMGADAVDVDLCPTRDGALVARHEPEIGGTTDVASHPEFTTDLTLAELRTLRAVERIPATRPHNTLYDGRFGILTFDEVLDLLDRLAAELRRPVHVLPEVKHSTSFAGLGLPVEPALVDILRRRGRDRADSGVIIQSFETASLEALNRAGLPAAATGRLGGRRPGRLHRRRRSPHVRRPPDPGRPARGRDVRDMAGPEQGADRPRGPRRAPDHAGHRRARGEPARHAIHVP